MADPQTLTILDRLIAFDTVSSRSNLDLIDWVERFLADRGWRLTRLPDASGQKAGLHAVLGSGAGGILLSGHTDVVPAEGQPWSRDPFRLTAEGDRLYGRGTTDMKGFVAAMLSAADRASQTALTAPLHLVLSYDEEVGCLGIAQMIGPLADRLGRPRACIVGEPTGMDVAMGHKGKVALRAVCHGQSGHSAMAPAFVNALHLATDYVGELRGLQAWLETSGVQDPAYDIPFSTVHIGRLTGGTALNIVPEHAEIHFEVRHLSGEAVKGLHSRLETAAERVSARYRASFSEARIELAQISAYPGLDTASDAEVTGLVQRLAGGTNVTKVPFGTEAGFFAGLSLPTVVCGPGFMADQGHKPDEYVTRDQLAACDRMMDRVISDLC